MKIMHGLIKTLNVKDLQIINKIIKGEITIPDCDLTSAHQIISIIPGGYWENGREIKAQFYKVVYGVDETEDWGDPIAEEEPDD